MRTARNALALPLLFVVVVSACGGAQSRMASHMERGQKFFSQGNFAKASVEFHNAVQLAPKSSAARIMARRTAESLGRPRDAVALYQSALELDPDNLTARTNLARLYVLGRVPQLALNVITLGLAKHPDSAPLLTFRAAAEVQLNKSEEAVADVERALKLAPTNEDAVALRVGLYRSESDDAKAIALLESTLRRAPSSASLREVLADVYAHSGDVQKSAQQLQALIRLDPEQPRYRYLLVFLYARNHRPGDAQRVLEDTVKAFPDSDDAKLSLVNFLTEQRGREAGERMLRAYIAQLPDELTLRLALGGLLQAAGASDAARVAYEEVVRRGGTGPNALTARDHLAAMDFSHSDIGGAHQRIAEVLKVNPRDNDALVLRAEISLRQNDPASATADLRAVLHDQPSSARLLRMLAYAYVQQGDSDLALQSMQSALDANSADPGVRVELAQMMLRAKQADKAVKVLEEANAPDNVAVQDALTRAYLVKRDFGSARSAAEALQKLRPDAPDGFYLEGLASQGQRRWDDAQLAFERVLHVKPDDYDALAAIAEIDMATGKLPQAIAEVKSEVTRNPKDAAALNLLGQLYLAGKQTALAINTLNDAVTVAPTWWVAYRNLGVAKQVAQDIDGAIAAYQAGIKAAPNQPQLLTELARLYIGRGRSGDAINVYEDWHRRNPQVQAAANNLAMLLVTYRQDKASLDQARDLTAGFTSSADSKLLDTNGWVHFKRAEYAAAVSVLQRAAQRAPDSKEIFYHLGMAELRNGQKDLARRDLQTAVSGSSGFAGADEARETLTSLTSGAG
jgi:tetratricopeptide (TPR) repeat protein